MPITDPELAGGCLCGTVRYRLASEPFGAGWCHCRMCQLNSGSPAMAFAKVPSEDFIVESGADYIRRYASSEIAERWFCGLCGTPLLVRDFGGATHDFSAATLDSPAAVTPEAHFHYGSRIVWADAADELPRFPAGHTE